MSEAAPVAKRYPPHPASLLFPALSKEVFSDLVEDVRLNGLRVPIVLYDGQVLDGRHREKACRAAGVDPVYVELDSLHDDPWAYVVGVNLHRRHLGKQERAELVARAWAESGKLDTLSDAARSRDPKKKPSSTAKVADELAAEAEVSRRTAERAIAAEQRKAETAARRKKREQEKTERKAKAEAARAERKAKRAAEVAARKAEREAKKAGREPGDDRGESLAAHYQRATEPVIALLHKLQRAVHDSCEAVSGLDMTAIVTGGSDRKPFAPGWISALGVQQRKPKGAAVMDDTFRHSSRLVEDLLGRARMAAPAEDCQDCKGAKCPRCGGLRMVLRVQEGQG